MLPHIFPIKDEMLVIKEQDADDLLDERLEHENDSEFVDINDSRLVSEIVEINPEADAFEPTTTVAIQPRWIHKDRCSL